MIVQTFNLRHNIAKRDHNNMCNVFDIFSQLQFFIEQPGGVVKARGCQRTHHLLNKSIKITYI